MCWTGPGGSDNGKGNRRSTPSTAEGILKQISSYFQGGFEGQTQGTAPKMPKKMIEDQTETEELEDLNAQFEETPEAQDDLYDAEREILQAFDADAKDELSDHHWQVFIYRVETGGKKDTPLFTCSPIELPVYDRVTKDYGTGDYKSRIYRNKKLFRVLPFRCEAPINTTPKIPNEDTAINSAVGGQIGLLQSLVDRVSQTPPVPVQNNPMEMIEVMSRMMETVTRMMPQQAPAPAAPGFDPMQMFELVLRGMEMGKDNSGGSESNVIDLIRDVLKGVDLGDILTAPQIATPPQRIAGPQPSRTDAAGRPTTGSIPADQMGAPAMPEGETPGPELKAERPEEIDPIVGGTIAHLAQFIPHAQRGADPALYADVILDNAPRDAIMHVVTYPDIETIFQASNPLIAENWAWFDALLNELREALSEPPEAVDLTEDPATGTGEEIQGQTITADQATDVSKPDEQPAPSGSNGDPERSGRHEGDAKDNVPTDKGGKEKPGSENKGG